MTDGLVPSGKAKAVVNSFLSGLQREDEEKDSSEDSDEVLELRPGRLGVGASASRQNRAGDSRTDRRLANDLERTKRKQDGDFGRTSACGDVDDPDESRTAQMGGSPKRKLGALSESEKVKKKKKKKKKKKMDKLTEAQEDETAAPEDKVPDQPEPGKKDDREAEAKELETNDAERPRQQDTKSYGEREDERHYPSRGEDQWFRDNNGIQKPKKKKTRSRQKNLRRDNRSKEQLPSHLTEETLLAGRMRPSQKETREETAS